MDGIFSMKTVYDILVTAEQLAKTKDKEALLRSLDEVETRNLHRVAKLALEPHINLGCTDNVFDGIEESTGDNYDLYTFLDVVESTANGGNGFRTDQSKENLVSAYGMLSHEDQYVVTRIFKRNLQCGVGATLINKVWPGTIFQKKYMRYDLLTPDNMNSLQFPMVAQIKKDAKFANLVIDLTSKTMRFFSRDWVENTQNYIGTGAIPPEAAHHLLNTFGYDKVVLHGEVGVRNDQGGFIPRGESNGKLNSKSIGIDNLGFDVWDVIPYEEFETGLSTEGYNTRWGRVTRWVNALQSCTLPFDVKVVESTLVHSLEEAGDTFRMYRDQGEEGIMLKQVDGIWRDGDSSSNFKVKALAECDLEVYGWEEGKNKYKGMVGSILLRSRDGMVVTKASGMSDELRDPSCWANGEIVSVLYNDVTQARGKDTYALSHPRFWEKRDDKKEADMLDDIVKQIKNANFFIER